MPPVFQDVVSTVCLFVGPGGPGQGWGRPKHDEPPLPPPWVLGPVAGPEGSMALGRGRVDQVIINMIRNKLLSYEETQKREKVLRTKI